MNPKSGAALILERVFGDLEEDLATWKRLPADGARLLWEARTQRVKLGDFAEEFFRRLARQLDLPMLLRKGELHRLVQLIAPASVPAEVGGKIDLLQSLFETAVEEEH